MFDSLHAPGARSFRLRLFLFCPLAGLLACHHSGFPDVAPGYHEFAYVANAGAGTVSVLDLVYLRADRTLRVGERPVALAVNPLRHEVYAVNQGSSSVSVIDAQRNQIEATIGVRHGPSSIAVATDGARAYVANTASDSISILDLHARREINAIAFPAGPSELRLAPDARTLAVVSRASGTVALFEIAPTFPGPHRQPLEPRATFSGCPGAASPVILPDSSKLFVACSAAHSVMVISLAVTPDSWAARSNATLLSDHLLTLLDVADDPLHLALKPDGGEIFVSNMGASSISEIATSTNEVGGTYTIADHPGHAIVSADNSTLWIANTTADSLGIYSIDDGRLVGSVHTGASPDALAFSADEHLLLAANYRSGDVSVIRTRGSGAPALFTMLPAGSSPVAIVTHAFTAMR